MLAMFVAIGVLSLRMRDVPRARLADLPTAVSLARLLEDPDGRS